jgi:hypothetical protein
MDSPDTGLGDALFPSLHPHRVTYWRLAVVVAVIYCTCQAHKEIVDEGFRSNEER